MPFFKTFMLGKPDADVSAVGRLRIGKTAALIGIACNLLLAIAKLTVGLLLGALSVTADAVNNLFDATGSVVTHVGFRIAEKPADAKHPFGHARFEYVAGTVVAATVLFVGFELASSAVTKIWHPAAVTADAVSMAVLTASVAVKLWLSFLNYRLGKALDSTTLKATAADARNDVLATVAVLAALLTEAFTGWRVDGYVGLAVALFILYSGITLLKETVDPLLGLAGSDTLRREITTLVERSPRVVGCHDLLLHDYGPNTCFASIHVEMDCQEDPLYCHELIDTIEHDCLETLGVHLVIHHDPVATNDAALAALRERVQGILLDYHPTLLLHDFRTARKDNQTVLLFDVTLCDDLRDHKDRITAHIHDTLQQTDPDRYLPVITFDPS